MASTLGGTYSDRYFSLDARINRHDAEGLDGPLQRGEEPFRWSAIEVEARALLGQKADFRVGIWLLRSLVKQHGLPGLCEGLGMLSALLAEPSEEVWPQPEEGEHPREAHATSLGWLGGESFLALLRSIPVHPNASCRLGEVLAPPAPVGQLSLEQRVVALQSLRRARDELTSIRDVISGSGAFWDRDPIVAIELLSDLMRLVSPGGGPLAEINGHTTKQSVAATGRPIGSAEVDVDGRGAVKAMLDCVLSYYANHEPSHPAPVLLRRVRRMVDASFQEVLRELYVEAPSLINRIEEPADKA